MPKGPVENKEPAPETVSHRGVAPLVLVLIYETQTDAQGRSKSITPFPYAASDHGLSEICNRKGVSWAWRPRSSHTHYTGWQAKRTTATVVQDFLGWCKWWWPASESDV